MSFEASSFCSTLLSCSSLLIIFSSSFFDVSSCFIVSSFLVTVSFEVSFCSSTTSSLETVSPSLDVEVLLFFSSTFSEDKRSVETYPVIPSYSTFDHLESTSSNTITSLFNFNFARTVEDVEAFFLKFTLEYFIYATVL